MHIKQSNKKSLIYDLPKRLLGLEFKSNHSLKSNYCNLQPIILSDIKESVNTGSQGTLRFACLNS